MNLYDLKFWQYKHFVLNTESIVAPKIIELVPEAVILFKESPVTTDYHLFVHELGHAIEVARKRQFHRLLLSNYGYGDVRTNNWSEKMADNEAKVCAQQDLLHDMWGINDSFLRPQNMGCFISVCVCGNSARAKHYHNLILSYKEELRDQNLQFFLEFIDYMIKYVKVN